MRRLALIIVMTGCVVGCTSSRTAVTTTTLPARTEVIMYQPWQPGGVLKSSVKVSATVTGNCPGPSDASNRPDAFRCSSNSTIMDPCLGAESYPAALCIYDPNEPATLMHLSEPTFSGPDQSPVKPWFIELADGTQCTPYTGTSGVVAGNRVNFGCSNGYSVVGDIDMSTPLWTVQLDTEEWSNLVAGTVVRAWNCRRSRNPSGGCSSYPAVGSGVFLVGWALVVLVGLGSCGGRRVDR